MYNKLKTVSGRVAIIFFSPIVLFVLLAIAVIGGEGLFSGMEEENHT